MGATEMFFKPTAEELRTAQELKIKGFEKMSAPDIRQAIVRERARLKALQEGREKYNKWLSMCQAMGAVFQTGKGTPRLVDLIRFYREELPVLLAQKGIFEGARLTIPPGCGLAKSGRATVGKLHPINADDRILITLTFDGQKAHPYDAWLVWRHARNVRRPR